MKKINFNPGKLQQWSRFKKKENTIWVAGHNSHKYISNIFLLIDEALNVNLSFCKKVLKYLGNHFGIIIITPNWAFAAVDYSRGYPIFWKISQGELYLSSQANLLSNKDVIKNQLLAFQMSGYTTHDNTLWKNVKNLKAGTYLFYKNKNTFYCNRYFSYFPRQNYDLTYKKCFIKLSTQIENLIKKIIKDVNGCTIIIPLSAGLDSRLIASGLKHFEYQNVKCFSYGLKNNFEAKASKKISEKLGYDWVFVEINEKKVKKFYNSKSYKSFLKDSVDGCSTSTIQGLLAVNELVTKKFISRNDIIINGNSGDFISGGHIPYDISRYKFKKDSLKKNFNKAISQHFDKHYSLWEGLKNNSNQSIIKNELWQQVKCEFNLKEIPFYGLIEFLEYDNRQTKYVVNGQRIYDFYSIQWLLPLWNKSFIKFWEKVPMKFKLRQKLYRDTLYKLNYGGVWTDYYEEKITVSPKWIIPLRFLCKCIFLFIGRKKWHYFEKKYISYWTENIRGFSSITYLSFIKSKFVPRSYVSIYTLIAEKNNLGKNWQEK